MQQIGSTPIAADRSAAPVGVAEGDDEFRGPSLSREETEATLEMSFGGRSSDSPVRAERSAPCPPSRCRADGHRHGPHSATLQRLGPDAELTGDASDDPEPLAALLGNQVPGDPHCPV
jgi:hypothetical protein